MDTGILRRLDATQSYRADIDGLRAVAVLAVVGYHAFPKSFPNGFIGVDVFFVISGFLISRNIGTALAAGRFSFADFYGRRIRRLFPALLLVLAAGYAAGWAFFFTRDFEQLGKHTAAGAGFVSNFAFNAEAGYFNDAPQLKPLLHLWSLGIEEQFYIVWPAVLWVAWRMTQRWAPALIVTGAASFLFCIAISGRTETAGFYLPITRVWEFAAGAWLGLMGTPQWRGSDWQREAAVTLGLSAIAATILLRIDLTPFPGWWAAVPVVGAALIIAGGPETRLSRLVLTNPIATWIGLISYPLYLWHWPLLSFTWIFENAPLSRGLRVTLVTASVVLAWLTFQFVERPIRRRRSPRHAVVLLASMIVVAAIGYATYVSGGVPSRAVARAAQPYVSSAQVFKFDCFETESVGVADSWPCHLNPSGSKARAMVVGDSHALALMPAFEQVARNRGEDVVAATAGGCPPLLGVQRQDGKARRCPQLNEQVLSYVTSNGISDVYLVAFWSYYTTGLDYEGLRHGLLTTGAGPATIAGSHAAFEQGLDTTLASYRAAGVTVHIVQNVPTQLRSVTKLIHDVVMSRGDPDAAIRSVSVPITEHRRLSSYASAAFARRDIRPDVSLPAVLLDLDAVYCGDGVCPFAGPGVSYYADTLHLSISGARLAVPLIAERFAAIAAVQSRIK